MPLKNLSQSIPSTEINKPASEPTSKATGKATTKKTTPKTSKLNELLKEYGFENVEALEVFLKRKKEIENLYGVLENALYNARNTIRNKPEVKAKDETKRYYRDFRDYSNALELIKEINNS